MNPQIRTVLKCVWSLRPTFRIHISGAHRGAEKINFSGLLLLFFNHFSTSLSIQFRTDSGIFARDCPFSRDESESSREYSMCPARESSWACESSHGTSFFARAMSEFRASHRTFSHRPARNFARDSATTTLFSCFNFACSLILLLTAHCFYLLCFLIFWNSIAASWGKAWYCGELLISCLILSRTHHGIWSASCGIIGEAC